MNRNDVDNSKVSEWLRHSASDLVKLLLGDDDRVVDSLEPEVYTSACNTQTRRITRICYCYAV